MIPSSGIAGSLQGKSLAEWKWSGSLEIISRENKLWILQEYRLLVPNFCLYFLVCLFNVIIFSVSHHTLNFSEVLLCILTLAVFWGTKGIKMRV